MFLFRNLCIVRLLKLRKWIFLSSHKQKNTKLTHKILLSNLKNCNK